MSKAIITEQQALNDILVIYAARKFEQSQKPLAREAVLDFAEKVVNVCHYTEARPMGALEELQKRKLAE